jgi:nucleoside-diphosphate-sugar epimerase
MKKQRKKNILIVGANGLLGRNLADTLSQTHTVFAMVKKKNKIHFKLNKNITVLEINLSNIDKKKLPNKIDVIYYLAQSNKRKNFPEGADDMIAINILAPHTLAKWGVKIGVKKFIYVSSGGVYDTSNKPLKEFASINGNKKRDFYLNSKLSAEMLLKSYSNLFETFIILRPFFIYGSGQKKNMLIPRLISNVKNDREININGKDGIKINPIYVTDAANAVANVLNIRESMIINIGGNEITSLKALILMIGDELAKQPIINNNKYTQNNLIGDVTLMRKKLFKPNIDLKTGVKITIKSIFNDK